MPRKARQLSSTGIHHVVIRGADRQNMFECNSDYEKYLEYLLFYKEKIGFKIYAYCLMSNHVHLIIDVATNPIDTIFRHLNTAYATWFNLKYSRTGFLQQGRYYSEPIETYGYLFEAIRYVHLNPLKAGLEIKIGSKYHWSSYCDYFATQSFLVETSYILQLFGGKKTFQAFHTLPSNKTFIDLNSMTTRLPDDVAKEMIFEECKCQTATEFQKLPLTERDKHLISLHKKGISIRQLNRLTGIPKGVVARVTQGHSS